MLTFLSILVPAFWILFDVLICLRTGYMTAPFSHSEFLGWLCLGIGLAVAAIVVGICERRAHLREKACQLSSHSKEREEDQREIDGLKEKLTELKIISSET
jgi:hypothetical protein